MTRRVNEVWLWMSSCTHGGMAERTLFTTVTLSRTAVDLLACVRRGKDNDRDGTSKKEESRNDPKLDSICTVLYIQKGHIAPSKVEWPGRRTRMPTSSGYARTTF